MGNNPILKNDPLGDTVRYKDGDQLNAGVASQILTSLTGIRPHISYDYTITYLEKDFINDTTEWHKWYEENKCKVSEALFDSTALKVRSNYQKQ